MGGDNRQDKIGCEMTGKSDHAARPAASPWVQRFAHLLPAGEPVLDLACGSGRHTAYLRELGYEVTALDRDLSRLGDLAKDPGVELVQSDLEDGSPFAMAGRRFGGVIVTNYLYRPLFPSLVEVLMPGGLLLYETFARGHERYGKPSNPNWLLNQGELLERARFERIQVLAFEDLEFTDPEPACKQRIAGRKIG